MKNKAWVLALAAVAAFQFGCDEKTKEDVLPSVSVIIGDVAGTWDSQCVVESLGASSNLLAYRDMLGINANGDVSISRAWSDSPLCLGTLMQHDIDATVSISGTNSLKFTVTSNEFRTYDLTLAQWLSNTGCPEKIGGFGNNSTISVAGVACTLGAQPAVNAALYNGAEVTSSTLKMGKNAVGRPLGYSSENAIPSSLDLVFTKR